MAENILKKVLGRIIKQNGEFYCAVEEKLFPIELDIKDKINNGDLVQIGIEQIGDTIKRSDLLIIKRISPKMTLPQINESSPLYKRLENRIFDLRNPVNHAIFSFRSALCRSISKIFDEENYTNVNTPLIVGNVVQGRVKTFDIDYFGNKASLAMTKLVYLRYLTCSDFNKIYDLSPVFVAGQHKTSSHVSEYYTFDWASTNEISFDQYLLYVNSLLLRLLTNLNEIIRTKDLKINFKFQELLNDIKNSKIVPYSELIKLYIKNNPGEKGVTEQFHLSEKVVTMAHSHFGKYIWVTEFPEKFKQFYCDTAVKNGDNIVLSSELWWNKVKVASVSFSGSDFQKSFKRIKFLGLDTKSFKTYLKAINLASSEAYLGSLYIERLMMVFLEIDNMKEVLMFPRSPQGTVMDP